MVATDRSKRWPGLLLALGGLLLAVPASAQTFQYVEGEWEGTAIETSESSPLPPATGGQATEVRYTFYRDGTAIGEGEHRVIDGISHPECAEGIANFSEAWGKATFNWRIERGRLIMYGGRDFEGGGRSWREECGVVTDDREATFGVQGMNNLQVEIGENTITADEYHEHLGTSGRRVLELVRVAGGSGQTDTTNPATAGPGATSATGVPGGPVTTSPGQLAAPPGSSGGFPVRPVLVVIIGGAVGAAGYYKWGRRGPPTAGRRP